MKKIVVLSLVLIVSLTLTVILTMTKPDMQPISAPSSKTVRAPRATPSIATQPVEQPNIKQSCVMNGIGAGHCSFTNMGNADGFMCGLINVKNTSSKIEMISNEFCSGKVAPSSTTEVRFHVPEVSRECEPVLKSERWSDMCQFTWVQTK
jgi:hypothetical protein